MTTVINGSSPSITFSDGSAQTSATRPFLNRIINGAMVIDQRNAGASVTPTDGQYTLDRWQALQAVASKYTVQQNAGSVAVLASTGFVNYLGCTSSSAYTVGSSDYFVVGQNIEGYNIADLGWGTANAKTVTLSFWVRSSLTGTFGGVIKNSDNSRSYPFSYTISSANTWTQTNITIAGDTSGSYATGNSGSIKMFFGLGVGSTYSGTAGSWSSGNFVSATGATSVVGTNGATFYITGVQLEVGSTATSFDYRPYGTELQLAQRYFEVGAAKIYFQGGSAFTLATSYHTSKRATGATVTTGSSPYGGTIAPTSIEYSGIDSFWSYKSSGGEVGFSWTSSSEL